MAARGGAGERARGRMEAGAGGGEGEGRGSGGGGGRMRGLLLRYMLWDALGRPGLWHAALLRDGARAGAWAGVLARAARGQGGPCGGWVALGTPGEVPLVPLLAATAMAEVAEGGVEGVPVAAVEPVRPVRAALKEAAGTNGLGGWLSALSAAPEGREGALYLAPGLEDIAALPGTLETLREAGSPARVLPSRVVVRALLLELPRQANPVRVPVGSVSGFDLGEFDRFAGLGTGGAHGAGLSHMARLRDLRFRELAAPALLADIRTGDGQREEPVPAEGTAKWTSGPLRPQREGVCHAVAVWADALLDLDCEAGEAGPWLDGGPEGSRARRQQLHILPRPVNVRPCEELRVTYEPRADGGPRLLLFVGGHLAASKGEGEWEECALEAADAAVERREVREAQESEAGALQTRVERWHFAMVNDHRRNDAYEAAIREAVARVGPSAHVLDIGAGSGLLGLMAARGGAKGVTGIERVGALAECARAIAAANGLAGAVQVLHAESTAVDSAALAGGHRADLLVSEILDDGLLGEHVLPSVADARARLIAPGAPIIPSAATVWAVAVDCQPAAEPLVAPFRACTTPFAEEGGGAGPDGLRRPLPGRSGLLRLGPAGPCTARGAHGSLPGARLRLRRPADRAGAGRWRDGSVDVGYCGGCPPAVPALPGGASPGDEPGPRERSSLLVHLTPAAPRGVRRGQRPLHLPRQGRRVRGPRQLTLLVPGNPIPRATRGVPCRGHAAPRRAPLRHARAVRSPRRPPARRGELRGNSHEGNKKRVT